MNYLNKITNLVIVCAALAVFTGCSSSIEKAPVPADADPRQEISKLEEDMKVGYENQYDVLANKDFRKAHEKLKEAKEELKDEDSTKDILESIAYSRAYLTRAQATSEGRKEDAAPILEARKAALASGVRTDEKLKGDLSDLDEDVIGASDNFKKNLDPDEYAQLQKKYQDLELNGIKTKYLKKSYWTIRDSRKNRDAESRAPDSLARAEKDLRTAENVISVNRYDTQNFMDEVQTANTSAQLLDQVLTVMKANKDKVTETAALQIVLQDQKIGKLENSLAATSSDLNTMTDVAEKQSGQLDRAAASVAIQREIEKARKTFNKDEAEVFQQGENLVVRLKKMAFPTGKADLPPASIALLAKVDEVVNSLSAKNVTVEGHTDSTGGAQVNMDLSQKRAETVAEYIQKNSGQADVQAVGYGFKKPIASNKDSKGRAQNRRVDVVIQAGKPGQDSSGTAGAY